MRLQLAGLCSRAEQNEYDLRQKCLKAGLAAEQTDSIIDFLKAGRYLDEHRYARAYANDKVRFAGWGLHKIRQGLIAKRVPAEIVKEALGCIDRKEYIDALKRVGIAKARDVDIRTREGRMKFYRSMAAKGFEGELITKLIDAILKKL